MKVLESQIRIRELMVAFATQAKAAAATGKTDFNHASETVLIPLFKEVFGYSNLENLNRTQGNNFPGLDLGDQTVGVAFQITGTADSDKVKDTLQKVVNHRLHETYSRIIIYIITEKQKTYSGSGYDKIVQGRFDFDKERDILDFRDVLKEIQHFQIDKLRRIENILEANFGDRNIPLFGLTSAPQTESVFLNLLEISFPQTLYVAEVHIDMGDDEEPGRSRRRRRRGRGGKPKGFISKRDRIHAALHREGLRFAADWEYHNGKIITFHDLEDPSVSLRSVIDVGTIESLSSSDFYNIDDNYERVFKSLLRRCLQQKLYHQQVVWQHEEGIFIFTDVKGEASRAEEWFGKKSNERDVYVRTMKNNKPDEILKCKHLAFEVQFRRFGQKWYLAITPNWFFSYDGYKKNHFCADDLKWLKLKENNSHVANHALFIAYFLKSESTLGAEMQTINMFEEKVTGEPRHETRYPFLSFGEYVTFDNAPLLGDKLWRPAKKDTLQMEFDL
jgi:hypothetical protein